MSFLAGEWAEDVPVANVYERVILMALARRANNDGTNAFPSRQTIARSAMCDVKTIQRHLDALRKRRVIAQGDQQAAAYLRSDRRPTVYDLLIPHSWYSHKQLSKVNGEREEVGLESLTPMNRPDLPEPPSKSARSDKGTSRTRKTAGHQANSATGGLSVPPCGLVDNSASSDPNFRPRGDSQSQTGGLSVSERGDSQSPESVLKDPVLDSLPPPGTATEDHTTGGKDANDKPTSTAHTPEPSGETTRCLQQAREVATVNECDSGGSTTTHPAAESETPSPSGECAPDGVGVRVEAANLLRKALDSLTTGQPPSTQEKHALVDLVLECWTTGAVTSRIRTELTRDMRNVRMIGRVWRDRLERLREDGYDKDIGSIPSRCGHCEARSDADPIAARMITTPDGACLRCPECHPRGRTSPAVPSPGKVTAAHAETRVDAMQHIRGCLSRRDNRG